VPHDFCKARGRQNKWGVPAYSGFHINRTLDFRELLQLIFVEIFVFINYSNFLFHLFHLFILLTDMTMTHLCSVFNRSIADYADYDDGDDDDDDEMLLYYIHLV